MKIRNGPLRAEGLRFSRLGDVIRHLAVVIRLRGRITDAMRIALPTQPFVLMLLTGKRAKRIESARARA